MCGCICLVFSALAEYAFILWKIVRMRRKAQNRRDKAEIREVKQKNQQRQQEEELLPRRQSLDKAETYLKEGISFEQLDSIAYAISDNEAADQMNQARYELMKRISNEQKAA